MHARWLSFVVWALLAASLAYWALMLMAKGPQAPAMTRPAIADGAPADWTRLFAAAKAAEAPVEAASSRYQLMGVVAPSMNARHPGEGVALIVVAGGLPKPVRVGQVVDGDLKLVEINRRDVGLGAGDAVTVRLSLAPGAAGAEALPGQMPPGAMPPPQFGSHPGHPQAGGPGPEGIVPPTAIGGALPPRARGAGSANPTK